MPSRIGHPQRKATSGRSPALLPNLINYPHSLEAYFKHEESSPRFPPPPGTPPPACTSWPKWSLIRSYMGHCLGEWSWAG